jgi:hypothetical protein
MVSPTTRVGRSIRAAGIAAGVLLAVPVAIPAAEQRPTNPKSLWDAYPLVPEGARTVTRPAAPSPAGAPPPASTPPASLPPPAADDAFAGTWLTVALGGAAALLVGFVLLVLVGTRRRRPAPSVAAVARDTELERHVSGVLSAAEAAAAEIRTQAQASAEEILTSVRREAAELHGEVGQSLRKLHDESTRIEDALRETLEGLRRATAELAEILGPPSGETLTDALKPQARRSEEPALTAPTDDA